MISHPEIARRLATARAGERAKPVAAVVVMPGYSRHTQ
jgi:hypothetical protein